MKAANPIAGLTELGPGRDIPSLVQNVGYWVRAPGNPDETGAIRMFSSAEYWRRTARPISRIVFSPPPVPAARFPSHLRSRTGYDEPETLFYAKER